MRIALLIAILAAHLATPWAHASNTALQLAPPDFEAGLVFYDKAVTSREPFHEGFKQAYVVWEPLADAGHPGAQYHLGLLHYLGAGGVTVDQPVGIGLIKSSAESGYGTAQAFLGLLAEHGDGTAFLHRDDVAIEWYTKAAESGSCAGVKRISHAFANGELGLTKSSEEAERWRGRIATCTKR